jgi:signal peptidase II
VTQRRFIPAGIVTALLVLLADQASKWWILNVADLPGIGRIPLLPVLDFIMVWNHGVTFGLFNRLGGFGPIVLGAVSLSVIAVLIIWLSRAKSRLVAIALGAIAGGALGNVIDRMRFGSVVDFIHVILHSPWGELFPWVFNVGDSAVVCGVAVLVLESQWPRKTAAPPDAARDSGRAR